jgi:hypothetical protein
VDCDPRCVYEPLETVVDVKCEVPGLNRYGEVADGYLILRGPVVPMTANCMDPSNCWTYSIGRLEGTIAQDRLLVPFETDGAKSIKRARKGNVPTAFSVEVNSVRLGNDNREEGVFSHMDYCWAIPKPVLMGTSVFI